MLKHFGEFPVQYLAFSALAEGDLEIVQYVMTGTGEIMVDRLQL